MPQRPVGIFDSGIGGLSVLAHIRQQLPDEPICYVADSAFAPYGCKPATTVQARCHAITSFLLEQQCKAIVIACNTATATVVHELRRQHTIPIVGLEPAIKPALTQSRSHCIGVLTTTATAQSEKFNRLLRHHAALGRVIVQPCPGLVEAIEVADQARIHTLLIQFLTPLLTQPIDALVLGCTHYPLIADTIAATITQLRGTHIPLIDSGAAIARELTRQLQQHDLRHDPHRHVPNTPIQCWSSQPTIAPLMQRIWQTIAPQQHEQIEIHPLPIHHTPAPSQSHPDPRNAPQPLS